LSDNARFLRHNDHFSVAFLTNFLKSVFVNCTLSQPGCGNAITAGKFLQASSIGSFTDFPAFEVRKEHFKVEAGTVFRCITNCTTPGDNMQLYPIFKEFIQEEFTDTYLSGEAVSHKYDENLYFSLPDELADLTQLRALDDFTSELFGKFILFGKVQSALLGILSIPDDL
jgi:hypothetical protein